jgi:PAT family beta-lactamase induction signal transducer AmpG
VIQTTSSSAWLRAILDSTLGRAIFNRRMLICIFTGFASGLPLYLILQLVPAWLRTGNVPLTVIGIFALAQIPFTWKFLWAPLIDRYKVIPWLGRRRSWMFVAQIALIAAIAWMGQIDISGRGFPWEAFIFTAVIALFSATQDIALDAFRREILPDEELGLGNAIHVNAYRIAGLIPGSLSLILADRLPWGEVFVITAAFMIPGLIMTLMVKEPAVAKGAPRTLRAAVVEPFTEFFGRHGLKSAVLVLLFIFLYKLGDSLSTALATPFYLDMGFSMTEIGIVAKNAGLWASVIGGILGGIWMIKLGINRALWVFGCVQAASTLGFITLAGIGPPYVAPQEYAGVPSHVFVQAVTSDVFAHTCANREIPASNERNARSLVGNSLRRYFNIDAMVRQAAGGSWEKASSEQRKRLTGGFQALLLHERTGSIFQHCDWNVEITETLADPGGKEVTVSTVMSREGAQPIEVAYLLERRVDTKKQSPFSALMSLLSSDTEAQRQQAAQAQAQEILIWRVLDITVDGKSLVGSYREIFADKLRTASPGTAVDPESERINGLLKWISEQTEKDLWMLLVLGFVVAFEALGVGLGTAAFVAFMARTTHPAYVATQLALFTSLMAVPRTVVNASAGWLVEGLGGWYGFLWLCFFLAIPGMLLLLKVAPWRGSPPVTSAAAPMVGEEKTVDGRVG